MHRSERSSEKQTRGLVDSGSHTRRPFQDGDRYVRPRDRSSDGRSTHPRNSELSHRPESDSTAKNRDRSSNGRSITTETSDHLRRERRHEPTDVSVTSTKHRDRSSDGRSIKIENSDEHLRGERRHESTGDSMTRYRERSSDKTSTANLIIIDVRYQLSTVFSTSLLLENR